VWHVRQLQRWAWERVALEKLLLRCRLLGRVRRFSAHGGGEGRGQIVVAARLQLVVQQVYRKKYIQNLLLININEKYNNNLSTVQQSIMTKLEQSPFNQRCIKSIK